MKRFKTRWLGCWLILMVSTSLFAQHYTRTDLTANASGVSPSATVKLDANLVNAWGVSRSSTSPWWVADNGSGKATLYDASGTPQSLIVTIPPPNGQEGSSAPTGTVFNFTTAFELAPTKPAVFLFATEDGTISGWNPAVQPTTAVIKVNRPKRLSIKNWLSRCHRPVRDSMPRISRAGRVEVFDAGFNPVFLGGDAFRSEAGADFAPFGIQNVGGNILVTYAKRQPGSTDEIHGAGLGRVMVFDPNGKLLLRLQKGPWFNAPWGIAQAPGDFEPSAIAC